MLLAKWSPSIRGSELQVMDRVRVRITVMFTRRLKGGEVDSAITTLDKSLRVRHRLRLRLAGGVG